MSGASQRRSTSEGGRGLLSSALNLPDYAQTNRLPEFNPERCASTLHINTSGFIDDKYWDHRGMHLESRICTRSKGGSSSIDKRFGDDFIRLGNEISDWGQIVLTYAQMLSKDNMMCSIWKLNKWKQGEVLACRMNAGF